MAEQIINDEPLEGTFFPRDIEEELDEMNIDPEEGNEETHNEVYLDVLVGLLDYEENIEEGVEEEEI